VSAYARSVRFCEVELNSARRLIVLMLAAAYLVHGGSAFAAATIVATPEPALLDQRIGILISGLNPNMRVRVTAKSQAQDSLWWRSDAVFIADSKGQVDLDHQSAQSGSYTGTDGMGLFWSMRPDNKPKQADHLSYAIENYSKPVLTEVEVADATGTIASASIERRWSVGLHSLAISDGIIATLYHDDCGARPLPGVLVIGGSDGGPGAPGVALLLASHGFAAVSLSYFGVDGLPPTLENVPLEYFAKALAWMRSQPCIEPGSIAIYAESRGTEAALFTAANDPNMAAVVARSPSFTFWSGVTRAHLPGKSPWTYQGKPQPFIANTLYPDFILTYLWDRATGTPVRQTPLFLEALQHATEQEKIAIPVEQIHAPVMLLAGADDQIWPSALMAQRIRARRSQGRTSLDKYLVFPDVGHAIPYVYLPTRGNWQDSKFAIGGTAEGMAKAQRRAWPQILEFLKVAAGDRNQGAMRCDRVRLDSR
jgi:pimeloyl-ACP methyl ester carboxylesterase